MTLALLILVSSVFNVVLVQCDAGPGQHEFELLGHHLPAQACSHEVGACDHDHHPADCEDSSLLDVATVLRAGSVELAAPTVVAVLGPTGAWVLNPITSRSQPHLCPRPPPRLRHAVDDLNTIRLLI